MSDDINVPATPVDSFSFFDVLEERTYPEETFSVYLDEGAAYEYAKLRIEVDRVGIDLDSDDYDDEARKAQGQEFVDRAEALKERMRKSRYVFHVKGVSDDRIVDAKEIVEERFSDKKRQRKRADGSLEKYLPEDVQIDYVRFLDAVMLSLHIQQIEAPNGKVMTAPSADEIAHFMDKAPSAAQARVRDKIHALRVESADYEAGIDEGF